MPPAVAVITPWNLVSEGSIPFGQEILGYAKEWINEDFTPDGIRVCFLSDDGDWTSSAWCGYHDEWHTINTDDKIIGEINNVPPTHWMPKPMSP